MTIKINTDAIQAAHDAAAADVKARGAVVAEMPTKQYRVLVETTHLLLACQAAEAGKAK